MLQHGDIGGGARGDRGHSPQWGS